MAASLISSPASVSPAVFRAAGSHQRAACSKCRSNRASSFASANRFSPRSLSRYFHVSATRLLAPSGPPVKCLDFSRARRAPATGRRFLPPLPNNGTQADSRIRRPLHRGSSPGRGRDRASSTIHRGVDRSILVARPNRRRTPIVGGQGFLHCEQRGDRAG